MSIDIPASEKEIDTIGDLYIKGGLTYQFLGVVLGDDDWYYIMQQTITRQQTWLSCVASIQGHDYEWWMERKEVPENVRFI